jgi:hypothetical protein
VAIVSIVPYVGRIGFYGDDWDHLARMDLALDHSLGGLFRALDSEWVRMRPVQLIHMALLYQAFGSSPLGYHVVNAMVFVAGLLCFFLALRELFPAERFVPLSIVLVYAALPNYSSDRFWVVACQNINLSATLYFASLYADLRATRASPLGAGVWKLAAVSSLLFSALAYEIFMPLFLLNAALAAYWTHRSQSDVTNGRALFAALPNLIALGLAVAFKAMTTVRAGSVAAVADVSWFAALLASAARVGFLTYGIELPVVAVELVRRHFDAKILGIAALLGGAIFVYLLSVSRSDAIADRRAALRRLIPAGLLVFVFGWAIYLTNRQVGITPTGVNNRTAIAAACGTATALVGLIARLSSIASGKLAQRVTSAGLIALICASGFAITITLSSFWVTAYSQQKRILSELRRQVPVLGDETAVILDGVCPYVGPAIVFESSWDLRGALRMLYRRPALRADVTSADLEVRHDGLYTFIYGYVQRYPLRNLLLYDDDRRAVRRISGFGEAREHLAPDGLHGLPRCPDGEAGFGVAVLASERVSTEPRDVATVEGWLDDVRVLPEEDGAVAVAAGWALVDRSRPPASVVISVAGRWLAATSRFVPRPDVAAYVGHDLPPCGWRIEFSVEGLAPGEYEIDALALPEKSSAVRPLQKNCKLVIPARRRATE